MKRVAWVALATALLVPLSAWAGGGRPIAPVPALGDLGLIALGIGLVGAGAAYLRKR